MAQTKADRQAAAKKAAATRERKAKKAKSQAVQECQAMKTEGSKNAFGKCVSGASKEESEADVEETVDAAKSCKAERNEDPDAFKEEYGTNESKRNAFGKCVSKTIAEQDDADAEETAAKS